MSEKLPAPREGLSGKSHETCRYGQFRRRVNGMV